MQHPTQMTDDEFRVWLDGKRRGIGGYDIAVLMGAGGEPYDVYAKFVDLRDEVRPTPAMKRGLAMETAAMEVMSEASGIAVTPSTDDDRWLRDGKLVGTVDGWAEPDGKLVPLEWGTGICEAKVPDSYTWPRYVEQGVTDTNYLQLQWYLGLSGKLWGCFAVLCYEDWRTLGGSTPPIVQFDPALYQTMRETADAFLHEHVYPRVPPPQVGGVDPLDIDRAPVGKEQARLEANEHIAAVTRYFDALARKKAAESDVKAYREEVEQIFTDLDAVTLALDDRRLHWSPSVRRSLDTAAVKRFLKSNGVEVDDFMRETSTRSMRAVGI